MYRTRFPFGVTRFQRTTMLVSIRCACVSVIQLCYVNTKLTNLIQTGIIDLNVKIVKEYICIYLFQRVCNKIISSFYIFRIAQALNAIISILFHKRIKRQFCNGLDILDIVASRVAKFMQKKIKY